MIFSGPLSEKRFSVTTHSPVWPAEMMLTRFLMLGALSLVTQAQTLGNATCTTDASTYTNSLGESPCYVAFAIASISEPSIQFWPALSNSSFRYEPTAIELCSSVAYNIISACAACQGGNWESWSDWTTVCNGAGLNAPNGYPFAIPMEIAIPFWAYYNYSGNANDTTFNSSIPHLLGEFPEMTNVTSISSTVASSTATATTTSTSSARASSNHGAAGAIAGGVIGGIAATAGLVGLAFLLYRRRTRNISQGATGSMREAPTDIGHVASFPMQSRKLYDPSDPSTYPGESIKSSDPSEHYHAASPVPSSVLSPTDLSKEGLQVPFGGHQQYTTPSSGTFSAPVGISQAIMQATPILMSPGTPHLDGRYSGLPEV
ncbi:hypothetical protein OE88DRAFT_269857 [Heliocybe sulcata]|uniref:Uncharacterized protein n=1 Tax=Heliocybe sulcata TaxID=5364 RepID=A0A5C3MZF5_9AGAM|nr:hypothetical protein OE88DRAFT_269857 [Heliocybe sulcata]